jgi:hypothetical protein
MPNTFTTDLLRTAITNRFAHAYFTEDKTGVPCPITSVRWIRAGSGNELTFAIDFTWQEWHQPYPDYVIRIRIEFRPCGGFRILRADGHGSERWPDRLIRTDGLADWIGGWRSTDTCFIDELASMCICDFHEAHSDQDDADSHRYDDRERKRHDESGNHPQALQDAAEDAYFATQDQAILDDYEDPPNDEGVTA